MWTLQLVTMISIFAINVAVMNDSNGNDTKIIKIMLLQSQSEHSNWSPWYQFLLLPSWMGIEPIHDGNGNDTKIMKIML